MDIRLRSVSDEIKSSPEYKAMKPGKARLTYYLNELNKSLSSQPQSVQGETTSPGSSNNGTKKGNVLSSLWDMLGRGEKAFETFSNRLVNSAFLGLPDVLDKKFSTKNYNEALKMKKEFPIASTKGDWGGNAIPGTGFSKASAKILKPVTSKIVSKIGANTLAKKAASSAIKAGLTEGLAGTAMGATEGIIKQETPEDIAKKAALYGGSGTIFAGALGALPPVAKKGVDIL